MRTGSGRVVRLEAADVLDPRLLAALVPAALVASVITRAPADVRATLAWVTVNVASLASAGLLLVALRLVVPRLLRNDRSLRIPGAAVVLLGAGLGLAKGVTTTAYGWTAGLVESVFVADEGWRWVSTTLQGAVLLPALALVRTALRRYRAEHAELIHERARRALLAGEVPGGPRAARVARFVAEARRRIDVAADPTVAVVLEDLVEERLRPLTHELWRSSGTATDFTPTSLLRAALRARSYPAVPVAVMLALTAFAARTAYAPLADNVLVSALNLVAVAVLLRAAGPLRAVTGRWDVARLLLTVGLTTGAVMVPELTLLAGSGAALGRVGATSVTFLWLLVLTVVASAARVAVRTRDAIRAELERLVDDAGDDAVAAASQRLHDRALADRLHSGLQNRLIAAARRIEASGAGPAVVRAEVEAVGRLLDELVTGGEPPVAPARAQIGDLVARWDGFVAFATDLDATIDTLSRSAQDRIAQVVTEAVNNAVRHGRAERVEVSVARIDATALRLVVADDGLGPVRRAPGLGTALFAAVSGGAWSLSPGPDGGSLLDVLIRLDP